MAIPGSAPSPGGTPPLEAGSAPPPAALPLVTQTQPPVTPAASRPKGRGPAILTFIGAGVVVCALVLGIAGALGTQRTYRDETPVGMVTAGGAQGPNAIGFAEVPGTADMDLEAGIYPIFEVTTEAEQQLQPQNVFPAGPEVAPVGPGSPDVTYSENGITTTLVAVVGIHTPGNYYINMEPQQPVGNVVFAVGEPIPMSEVTLVRAFVGLAYAGAGVAFLAMLAGIIWWIASRNRRARAMPGQVSAVRPMPPIPPIPPMEGR